MSMTLEKALDILNRAEVMVLNRPPKQFLEAGNLAMKALEDLVRAERESSRPLTIEELRQINGEPVWLDGFEWRVCYGTSTFRGSEYLETGMGSGIPLDGYGQTWFGYRHKPKEETT